MSLVKICGIREAEHALAAQESGADFIGFVFVDVPRKVSPDVAKSIVQRMRASGGSSTRAMGLFVDEESDHINRIAAEADLDGVQLCGDEDPSQIGEISLPVVKAVRIASDSSFDDACRLLDRYFEIANPPAAILIDTHVKGRYGGTGVVGNWELAAKLSVRYPIVLAGGLSPDNVSSAISQVKPLMVDVSSGVETDKRKDGMKIRHFVDAVRVTSGSLSSDQYRFLENFRNHAPQRMR